VCYATAMLTMNFSLSACTGTGYTFHDYDVFVRRHFHACSRYRYAVRFLIYHAITITSAVFRRIKRTTLAKTVLNGQENGRNPTRVARNRLVQMNLTRTSQTLCTELCRNNCTSQKLYSPFAALIYPFKAIYPK
jgi:hypothetical protein